MNTRQPKLIDILYPPVIPGDPRRAAATRTIQQPDIDPFEQSAGGYLGECQNEIAAPTSNPSLLFETGVCP